MLIFFKKRVVNVIADFYTLSYYVEQGWLKCGVSYAFAQSPTPF